MHVGDTMHASIDVHGTKTAHVDAATLTTAVLDHHDVTVLGLRAATRTLSGGGTSHTDARSDDGSVPHTVHDVVGTVERVAFDVGAPYPRAGSITSDDVSTVTPTTSGPIMARTRAVIDFDGTSIVTLT